MCSVAISRCGDANSSTSTSTANTLCVDSTRHYCSLCLDTTRSLPPDERHIGLIRSYSLTTSTATLFHHLTAVHDIPLLKASLSTDDDSEKPKQEISSFTFSPATEFIFSPATDQQELDRDFMVWLALDLEPFSMVNNRGLQYFFGKNFPQLQIPDESTLRNKHVMEVYDSLVDKVQSDLASVDTINLMFDIWTDKHRAVHYVGVRAQFIREDWTGCVVTLSVKPCIGDADSISEHIINEVCHFVPRYREKLLYSTHDGAVAVIKASKLLRVRNWNHCVAHALHLLLTTDSLKKIPCIVAILHKCKSIVNTLHFKTEILEREMRKASDRTALTELLDNIAKLVQLYNAENQYPLNENIESEIEMKYDCHVANKALEQHEEPFHHLQNEVSTRWSSSLHMMETLLRMRAEITNALTLVDKRDQCLKAQEWALIEELTTFLQTFRCLTELVSAHITSLSLIQLIRVEVLDACTLNPNDSEELQITKKLIKENLDVRLPLSETAILATLLDPATKALLDATDEVKEEILYNALITGCEATRNNFSISEESSSGVEDDKRVLGKKSISGQASTPVSKRMKLIQKHTHSERATPTIKQRQEIKNYLLYNPSEQDDDPLAFWKSGKFPLLEALAKKVLTQSACSVPVENMFSTIGLLLSGKRSSLAPHTANWLSFIHDNYALYFNI